MNNKGHKELSVSDHNDMLLAILDVRHISKGLPLHIAQAVQIYSTY